MGGNGSTREGPIDWEVIERDVLMSPGMTLKDAAEKHDVSYRSVQMRGGPTKGNWIALRHQKLRNLALANDERLTEILAHDRADNVHGLRELEKRLEKVCLSALELLFPPADAPVEVQLSARNRLETMSGSQLGALVSQGMRTLTETGRHRRLLSGEATAIFARAESPDVYLPEPIEVAQALEMRSRMAQAALRAAANGEPIDIEGFALSPVSVPIPVPVTDSPTPLGARNAAGIPGRVTNEDAPDVGL